MTEPHQPRTDVLRGTYTGPHEHLKGERAIIQLAHGAVLAQFTDVWARLDGARLGFGWHIFPRYHFKLDDPT